MPTSKGLKRSGEIRTPEELKEAKRASGKKQGQKKPGDALKKK